MSKIEIKVPSAGESVTEATIASHLKQTGDVVSLDEHIFEIETDKASMPVPSPAAGKIEWHVKPGDVVKVGDVVGTIDDSFKAETKQIDKPKVKPEARPQPVEAPKGDVRKSADSFFSEQSSKPAPTVQAPEPVKEGRTTRKKMTKLRKIIAQKLVEVKNQTAMLTTFNEVDMTQIMAMREKEQEAFQKKHGVKLGFMSFFIKACVSALQQFPDINARIEGDEIVSCNYYDIGVAVGTEKGLMVPVLRDVDQMSYADIEKALKGFAEKARAGTISVNELQGGTFTITNGGVYGSLLSTPILNPPQSGILGMHNIVKRPIAIDDEIVIRPMMYLALSYDHRIVDGKESIGFLVHIKKNLEDPARFLLDL
jgi:2-oxoglutarate dehydrogenase E2 component (dihydrolipoamide succinyltransferase)